MVEKEYVGWDEAEDAAVQIAEAIQLIEEPDHIVGIARGGLPLAVTISHRLDVPMITLRATHYDGKERADEVKIDTDGLDEVGKSETVLLVDDVADTGRTLAEITDLWDRYDVEYRTAVWHRKPGTEYEPNISVETTDDWIVYPWEEPSGISEAER